jgi:hypothetical protein
MQLNDDDIWAIAIGMEFTGIEKNFLIYANRLGFTLRSRTKGAHSTLKELNENNVREQIAFIYRINIEKFQHRPRPVRSMGPHNGPTDMERSGMEFRVIDRLKALESELNKFQGQEQK